MPKTEQLQRYPRWRGEAASTWCIRDSHQRCTGFRAKPGPRKDAPRCECRCHWMVAKRDARA